MKRDKLKTTYKVLFWFTVSLLILGIFLLIQGMTSPINAYWGTNADGEGEMIFVNYGNLQHIINNGYSSNIFEMRSLLLNFKEQGTLVNDLVNKKGTVVIAAGTEWNDGFQLVLNMANTTLSGFITMLLAIATGAGAIAIKVYKFTQSKQ